MLTAEDGLADTVRPRLDLLGADPARVHVLTGVGDPEKPATFTLQDIAHLESAVSCTGAKLIVIDPLSAYLGADTNSTGVRAGLVLGDLRAAGHVGVQYHYHHIEQDAVLAAFNADDWWFHSRLRGHRGNVSVALGHGAVFGISGSLERRDDLQTWTKRLLLDLRVAFSS